MVGAGCSDTVDLPCLGTKEVSRAEVYIYRVSNSLENQDFFSHVSILSADGAAAVSRAHTHGPLPPALPSVCAVGRVGILRGTAGWPAPPWPCETVLVERAPRVRFRGGLPSTAPAALRVASLE